MYIFPLDNHFPQVSYVNLHNPDGITCGDATACNSLLKDFDGNVITTSYFDRDVIVTPPNNTYNCIKIATTAVSRSYCGTGRRVVCELGCGKHSDLACLQKISIRFNVILAFLLEEKTVKSIIYAIYAHFILI